MLARDQRLNRSAAIFAVLRRGKRRSSGVLAATVLSKEGSRATVIVSTKVSKKAVLRNLVKRRLRAQLREGGVPQGWTVVHARPGAAELPGRVLMDRLAALLPRP